MQDIKSQQALKMDPRVISNDAHIILKLCPGDEEPQDFEEL